MGKGGDENNGCRSLHVFQKCQRQVRRLKGPRDPKRREKLNVIALRETRIRARLLGLAGPFVRNYLD